MWRLTESRGFILLPFSHYLSSWNPRLRCNHTLSFTRSSVSFIASDWVHQSLVPVCPTSYLPLDCLRQLVYFGPWRQIITMTNAVFWNTWTLILILSTLLKSPFASPIDVGILELTERETTCIALGDCQEPVQTHLRQNQRLQ